MFVFHVEEKLDDVDIDLQGFGRVLIACLLRRGLLRRFLSSGKRGQGKDYEQESPNTGGALALGRSRNLLLV